MNFITLTRLNFVSLVACSCVATSHAAIVVNISQVGSDVVASGSGSFDISGLTLVGTSGGRAMSDASRAAVIVGASINEEISIYSGVSGPTSLGSGGVQYCNSGSGDKFGIYGYYSWACVPMGYVSGTELSANAIWNSQTFSSLGLTEGTYTWTWGSGGNEDSFTLNITAVPEPSQWGMVVATLAGLGGIVMRRYRKS